MPKGVNTAIYHQVFETKKDYNKLYFQFGKYKDYKEYTLEVILLKHKKDGYQGYKIQKPITLL